MILICCERVTLDTSHKYHAVRYIDSNYQELIETFGQDDDVRFDYSGNNLEDYKFKLAKGEQNIIVPFGQFLVWDDEINHYEVLDENEFHRRFRIL